MLLRFQTYIKDNKLFKQDERFLLAVSGGVDSVVMAQLFKAAGLQFVIAHCNFGLRGSASDGDETFVRNLAATLEVPCETICFDTLAYSTEYKLSIQESARTLRYSWFEKVRLAKKLNWICTAHHADDSIETFFINLLRGTGLAGLTGIPLQNGNIIRPLLFANKTDLLAYAKDAGIAFRDDSSNEHDAYLRNKLRHTLFPVLEQLSPSFRPTLTDTMHRLKQTREVIQTITAQTKKELRHSEGGHVFYLISDISSLSPLRFWLHALLDEYGFNESVCTDLEDILQKPNHAGKLFQSADYQLDVERNRLLIRHKNHTARAEQIYIQLNQTIVNSPLELRLEYLDALGDFTPLDDPAVAFLDLEKLTFPLLLRKWKTGDRFRPLGMKGSKLLSDFFSDQKFSLHQKEQTWVLESDGKIAWVVGHRVDDRFKMMQKTREALFICLRRQK